MRPPGPEEGTIRWPCFTRTPVSRAMNVSASVPQPTPKTLTHRTTSISLGVMATLCRPACAHGLNTAASIVFLTLIRGLLDDHLRLREPLCLTELYISVQRFGAARNSCNLAVGVEIEIDSGHVKPGDRIVLETLERVHRIGRLVEDRTCGIHIVVFLIFPSPR